MKNILTLICLALVALTANAQAPNYDDLKILYADANYEKLAKVASGYTENDKTKKDVLPYIWLSKGLYKISLSGSDNDKFKNAYKDAIKYLGKGITYDHKYNEGATLEEHKEFIESFQLSLQELIENEISSGNFKRAYGWVIKYQKVTSQMVGVKYLLGACKYEDQDKATARAMWNEGDALMTEITSIKGWSEADINIFRSGLLLSANAMVKARQADKARALLNKAAQWFEEDEVWKEQYNEIVN